MQMSVCHVTHCQFVLTCSNAGLGRCLDKQCLVWPSGKPGTGLLLLDCDTSCFLTGYYPQVDLESCALSLKIPSHVSVTIRLPAVFVFLDAIDFTLTAFRQFQASVIFC